MSFRTRALVIFTGTLVAVIALVTITFTLVTRKTWRRIQDEQFEATIAQFRSMLSREGERVADAVLGIATSETILKIAIISNNAAYYDAAGPLAKEHRLDLLTLASSDGTIVSSAEWPARFGYREEWLLQPAKWNTVPPFFQVNELPEGNRLVLTVVRTTQVEGQDFFVAGGILVNDALMKALPPSGGTNSAIYQYGTARLPSQLYTTQNKTPAARARLDSLLHEVSTGHEVTQAISWADTSTHHETIRGIPLRDRQGIVLAALLIDSTSDRQVEAERLLRLTACGIAIAGMALLFSVSALTLRGYDIFVSYRRCDASTYAATIVGQLQVKHLRCFLDTEETPGGVLLTPTIQAALRTSRFMLIILSSGATESRWIREELTYFTTAKGKNVIPLNVNGFLESQEIDGTVFASLRDLAYLNETDTAVQEGGPSPMIVPAILQSYARIRTSAQTIITALVIAFFLLSALLVWLVVRQA